MKFHSIRIGITCVLMIASIQAAAQQMRIESNVYSSGQSSPIAISLTLLDSTAAYDFSLDPDDGVTELEIAIYDHANRNLVLLDCQRQLRLELQQFEILKMVEEQRLRLSQRGDLSFLVDPAFKETMDLATNVIELIEPNLTYRALCERPKEAASLPAYYEALNQFAKLAASDPQRLPPFPRLALNQAIQRAGLIPREIEFKLTTEGVMQRDMSLRSTHTTIWQLSDLDRDRIGDAKKKWMAYKQVSLGKFRGLRNNIPDSGKKTEGTETSLPKLK